MSSSHAVTEVVRKRRRSIGAEAFDDGVHFRVWAPRRRSVSVVIEEGGNDYDLAKEEDGYFSALLGVAREGTLYRFRLDGGEKLFPDPASRWQPDGPHGPSAVVNPTAYRFQHPPPTLPVSGHVIYEMHIGTFTREGTWRAAARELPWLADLGITTIEIMPVHDFPGSFGWGYDGVNLWAPTHLYGRPDDFRAFVDAAHSARLAVILDVVYNHFGPDGNHLNEFSPAYFTDKYPNDWGKSINFDGEDAAPVREFFRENAAYWIDEYDLDGLRFDATQSIVDLSDHHILGEMTMAARAAAGGRTLFLVVENEEQRVRMLEPIADGGYGANAMWNDDFHHAVIVALTGRREAYYTDYCGSAQEFVSAAKWGFLYQGQRYKWQKKRRGTDSRRTPRHGFVWYLENHDQVANSADGRRLHQLTSAGRMRAMTALLLLGPATPMLFQGQEFGSTAPFLYFADHKPELAELVFKGRRKFLRQFPSLATEDAQRRIEAPHDRATFERCRLDLEGRRENADAVALHRDLLRLRQSAVTNDLDGAVLSDRCFLLRSGSTGNRERLLIVNLGTDLHFDPAPEPLLAPPSNRLWTLLWSSEATEYGGRGTAPVETEEGWQIPGEAAVLLEA